MKILKNLIPLILLIFTTTLAAQNKLALANECFEVKAYYLATRYYQQVFSNSENCHPDQIKLAQALNATEQREAAEEIYQRYSACEASDPKANIHYGKFLMGEGQYEKAMTIFEKAAEVEPELSRHYILACKMALPGSASGTPVLVNQTEFEMTSVEKEVGSPSIEEAPTSTIIEKQMEPVATATAPAAAMIVVKNPVSTPKPVTYEASTASIPVPAVPTESPVVPYTKKKVTKISPYGVRLGTYSSASAIPDYSELQSYGEISIKQWSGRSIVFLTGFASRADAEAVVKLARSQAFNSATLVKKQASGRMKSVRD